MNKPSRSFAKPLRDVVGKVVGEALRGRALLRPSW